MSVREPSAPSEPAWIDRCVEFIAAAIQVPSFLIMRKGDAESRLALADPRYDNLLRHWQDTAASAAPSPQMDEFVFSLASAHREHLYRTAQRGGGNRSAGSAIHIETMISWMQVTPISHIAELAACWLRIVDAEGNIEDGAALDANRRAALAWQMMQTDAAGLSFRAAQRVALASQPTDTALGGRCGHRRP